MIRSSVSSKSQPASISGDLKVTSADKKRVAVLIADLDSDQFAKRNAALKELEQFGSQIEAQIVQALKGGTSLEARRRLEQILKTIRKIAPEELGPRRAIQILEQIGSPEARAVLHALANGAEGAHVTRDATESLHRLTSAIVKAAPSDEPCEVLMSRMARCSPE